MAQAKLTETDVRLIRKLNALGVTQTVIARGFGIGQSTVFQVINYVTYKWVSDD